jgi:integrase/recombinase XerD
MKQAKVINEAEMKRLLAVVDASRHAERNRVAIMLSYFGGFRVGEIAALKNEDVIDDNGEIRDQIYLKAEYTKGNHARTVFVSKRLSKELKSFKKTISRQFDINGPFLKTQKNTTFSANTLCQLFGELYSKAGISGASSHSGRRKFVTRMAHSGISPKVIMTLVGHRHLSTTQKYIDVNDEMLKAAVEVI